MKKNITISDLVERLKVWKEMTTTLPSGLHFGHYKSLIANHDHSYQDDQDPNKQKFDDIQVQLLQYRVNLINYAIQHGYSYDRWKVVVTQMIMKEENNHKIHRLRAIYLYEADYSALLALHWRDVLHAAEDKAMLNVGT